MTQPVTPKFMHDTAIFGVYTIAQFTTLAIAFWTSVRCEPYNTAYYMPDQPFGCSLTRYDDNMLITIIDILLVFGVPVALAAAYWWETKAIVQKMESEHDHKPKT